MPDQTTPDPTTQATPANYPPAQETTTPAFDPGGMPPSERPEGVMVQSGGSNKRRNRMVLFGVLTLVLLVGTISTILLVQKNQELREKASSTTGIIAIFKMMCIEIGQQDVCNGRDTSLKDYKIDYHVHNGSNDQGSVVQTITVQLSNNDQSHGNTGDGSQGRNTGSALETGIYTVCEVPVAYKDNDRVPLHVEPRPTASQGGSSGGSPQNQFGDKCITVQLNPGEPELKFLNRKDVPASPTPTITPTFPPGTKTPTPSPTHAPTATLPPGISAACGDVIAYDLQWNQLSSTQLSQLKSGDKVRYTVAGTTTSGTFDKAKFTVNGTDLPETTNKKPGTDSFYTEYTLPSGTTTFSVTAQVHHSTLGWF